MKKKKLRMDGTVFTLCNRYHQFFPDILLRRSASNLSAG